MRHTIRIEIDIEGQCPEVKARLRGHRDWIREVVELQVLQALSVNWGEDRYGVDEYVNPKAVAFRLRAIGPNDTFKEVR